MIRAAIVGMGWWGQDARGSGGRQRADSLRRRRDAHGVAGGEGVRRGADSSRWSTATRPCWRTRTSTRWCWRRRTRCTRRRRSPPRRSASTSSARSPSPCTRPMPKRRSPPPQQAGVTLGLGYNRRFHPEMTKLRQQIQSGDARDAPALRSDDDLPECAVSETGRLARGQGRDAVRRADADGRARHRRDDRSGRRDRAGLLSELPPRRAGRERRHDVDAVSHEERRVGLSRARSRRPGPASASRCLARRARCGSRA